MWHIIFSSLSENINMVQKRIKLNCNSLYSHTMCIPKGKDGKLGTLYHCIFIFQTLETWSHSYIFLNGNGWIYFSYMYKSTADTEKTGLTCDRRGCKLSREDFPNPGLAIIGKGDINFIYYNHKQILTLCILFENVDVSKKVLFIYLYIEIYTHTLFFFLKPEFFFINF